MINILSHIVEFRNGESGMHVLHIQTATDILLHTLVQKTDKYHLTAADIRSSAPLRRCMISARSSSRRRS